MIHHLLRFIAVVLALWPAVAAAEPVKLKLAFFSSDRTHLYRSMVKPFVDAVNAEGKGRVEIEVFLSGRLGADLTRQSQLALDGTADIVYVVPPYERKTFHDSGVIEQPGLFRDGREATLVFSRLVAAGTIRDFKEFFVIGAVASEPQSIHSRPPIASLGDLKGKRIRTNNDAEAAVVTRLAAVPAFVPLNQTAEDITRGTVDGAYLPPVPMIEFGIGRVASNHFMLRTSCVPLTLLMSRKKFDSLPADIRAIVAKYSGEWLAQQSAQINESSTELVMNQLDSDPKRKVVVPSAADMQIASGVFKAVLDEFVAGDPHHAVLVRAVKAEIAKLRPAE